MGGIHAAHPLSLKTVVQSPFAAAQTGSPDGGIGFLGGEIYFAGPNQYHLAAASASCPASQHGQNDGRWLSFTAPPI